MAIQRIESGTHLSKVVIHGDTVYLAGMTANKTLGGSVTEQTREILGMIDSYLAQAGTDVRSRSEMDSFAQAARQIPQP